MHFFLHFRKGKTQAAQSVQADPVAEKLRFSFVSSLYTDPTLRASVERWEKNAQSMPIELGAPTNAQS